LSFDLLVTAYREIKKMAWTFNTADNTPTDGPALTAIAIAFTVTSLLVVLLRAYVRVWMLNAVGYGKKSVA
jgi:hypothetical protein